MKKLILGLILVAFMAIPIASAKAITNPYFGKMIALDAGHGGTEIGAPGAYGLLEKDVNLEVVKALESELVAAGAKVILTREEDVTISSRKERVAIAKSKCLTASGRECDILVSVHHNGSSNPETDGTMVIYNEKQDKPLAFALHDSLIKGLGLPDLGYENGGYGITVYGHMISALTEGFFITNNWEVENYATRKDIEVKALFEGIGTYFLNKPAKKGR